MSSRVRRRRRLFLGLAGAAALAGTALRPRPALAFPDRPIRWIVAYPAGGGSDALARLIGAAMAERLGQPVVVDNRPGAGATLGADAAAKAPPDGHTVFSADPGILVHAAALFRRLPFDPARDFRAVGLFADTPLAIAVPAASPLRTLAELLAAARDAAAAGRAVACGTPGVGSPHHLAVERLMREAGVRLDLVPYRGGAPALNDLIAGTLPSAIVSVAALVGPLRAGAARALAVTGEARFRGLPAVPTVAEAAGLPGYRAPTWQGLVAPAATPDERVRRLAAALEACVGDPALQARIVEAGAEPRWLAPAAYDALMAADRAEWLPLIRALGVTLDG